MTTNNTDEQHELPDIGIISGLAIDGEQNLWLSTMQDNSIIKFDSKAKKFTKYEVP